MSELTRSGIRPLYLFRGRETLLFDKFVAAAKAKFQEDHGSSGELLLRWGTDLKTVDDLQSLLVGGGLFSTARLIIVQNIEHCGQSLKKTFAEVVANIPEGTYLILRYEGDDRRKPWLDRIQKRAHFVNIQPPNEGGMNRVINRLADLRELQISQGAIDQLIRLSGGDLNIIDQEIEKISLYLNGTETSVNEEHVSLISGLTEHARADDFLLAFDHRDRAAAVQALKEIARQGNESIPYLVVTIAYHITVMRLMKDPRQPGVRLPWVPKEVERQIAKGAALYSSEELEDALMELAAIDRGTRLGTTEILTSFTEWLSKIL